MKILGITVSIKPVATLQAFEAIAESNKTSLGTMLNVARANGRLAMTEGKREKIAAELALAAANLKIEDATETLDAVKEVKKARGK